MMMTEESSENETTEYQVQALDGDIWMRYGVYYHIQTAQILLTFLKSHNPLQQFRIVQCTTKREVVA